MNRSVAAQRVWRARSPRSVADRAYIVYAAVLVAFVLVSPVARAIWVGITTPSAVVVLTSPVLPTAVAYGVLVLWIVALAAGPMRGPALLPTFLSWSLGGSDVPRRRSHRGPLVLSFSALVALTALAAVLPAGSLLSHGLVTLRSAAMFVLAGAEAGAITFGLWLAAQVSPRGGSAGGAALVGLGIVGTVIPQVGGVLPWTWVASTYPSATAAPGSLIPVGLGMLMMVVVAIAMTGLERLGTDDLVAQATQWEMARTRAMTLDLDAASATYRVTPSIGRSVRAVPRTRSLLSVFVIRGLVGALRTPGRFIIGTATIVVAGFLMADALQPSGRGGILGAAAGLLLYLGLGPLTDGLRHAARVVSSSQFYGVSDEVLMALHAVMPLVVGAVASTVGAALLPGGPQPMAIAVAVLATVMSLGVRIGNALKGPLPSVLLTPAPTALGDPMPFVQLLWAMDSIVLALLVGLSVASVRLGTTSVVGVVTVVAAMTWFRWNRRP